MPTVLMNAGPWLPVPPAGYGGIERVVAALVPELRRRGVRVVLATVGESTLEAERRCWVFPTGQFRRLAGPYSEVTGIAHAHMQCVLEELEGGGIDLVHDHLEVVGASVLAARGRAAPPTLHTLHWSLRKHPEFYRRFDGHGRVLFNGVSAEQLEEAPANLRAQTLGAVPLGIDPDAYQPRSVKDDVFVTMARVTPNKGVDIAARLCKQLGVPLVLAGPVAGVTDPDELAAALADPADPLHGHADARYYLEQVRVWEDGERIRWVGGLDGAAKHELLARARALLAPLRWREPGGTVALEALACGTPVIAMRRGVMPTIVEHGVNGFLADDEREFAGYLRRAGEIDPAACRRTVVERFSAARMAERYLELYAKVIAAAG
jgi:glycosyltransferase involved in cell wall biosynthesis